MTKDVVRDDDKQNAETGLERLLSESVQRNPEVVRTSLTVVFLIVALSILVVSVVGYASIRKHFIQFQEFTAERRVDDALENARRGFAVYQFTGEEDVARKALENLGDAIALGETSLLSAGGDFEADYNKLFDTLKAFRREFIVYLENSDLRDAQFSALRVQAFHARQRLEELHSSAVRRERQFAVSSSSHFSALSLYDKKARVLNAFRSALFRYVQALSAPFNGDISQLKMQPDLRAVLLKTVDPLEAVNDLENEALVEAILGLCEATRGFAKSTRFDAADFDRSPGARLRFVDDVEAVYLLLESASQQLSEAVAFTMEALMRKGTTERSIRALTTELFGIDHALDQVVSRLSAFNETRSIDLKSTHLAETQATLSRAVFLLESLGTANLSAPQQKNVGLLTQGLTDMKSAFSRLHDLDKELVAARKVQASRATSANELVEKLSATRINSMEFSQGRAYSFLALLAVMTASLIVLFYLAYLSQTALEKMRDALKRERDRAERAGAVKAEFLANMSHEIRTPMNAIIGMSQLALRGNLPDKERGHIERVQRSASALLAIINDILDFSKIEAGELRIESVVFGMSSVIRETYFQLSIAAEEGGVELYFEVSPVAPERYTGDPFRIQQVLVNLGSNAIKFTDKGGQVVISLHLEEKSEDSALISISVTDTGIGMTDEQQARLFKSFSQADSSITRRYGGSGLGLMISKQLVEQMGGRLSLTSKPGKGTCVTCKIPLTVVSSTEEMYQVPPSKDLRCVIVGGGQTQSEILSSTLEAMGVNVQRVFPEADSEQLASFMKGMRPVDFAFVATDVQPSIDACIGDLLAFEILKEGAGVIMIGSDKHLVGVSQDTKHLVKAVVDQPLLPSTVSNAIQNVSGHFVGDVGAKPDTRAEVDEERFSRLRGARVLLVEDNIMNMELALELLEGAGMVVTTAVNGQSAINVLRKESFDCVLMDCQMPVMDGYTATSIIRRNEKLRDLPIIALTANALPEDRQAALDAGMTDHVMKPIDFDVLFTTLCRWVSTEADAEDAESLVPESPTVMPNEPIDDGASRYDESELDVLLENLPGVVAEAARRGCRAQVGLYRRQLERFERQWKEFDIHYQDACRSDDAEAPARLFHSLKANAGQIGAIALQGLAAHIERVYKQGEKPSDDTVAAVSGKLNQLLVGARRVLVEDHPSESAEQPSHPVQLGPRLIEIRAALLAHDPAAIDMLRQLARLCRGSDEGAEIDAITEKAIDYLFDDARRLIDKFLSQRGKPQATLTS